MQERSHTNSSKNQMYRLFVMFMSEKGKLKESSKDIVK